MSVFEWLFFDMKLLCIALRSSPATSPSNANIAVYNASSSSPIGAFNHLSKTGLVCLFPTLYLKTNPQPHIKPRARLELPP